MRTVYYDILMRGGVAATHELLRDGHTSRQLTRAVRAGEIVRARQGHYVVPELDPHEIAAIRVGGRLTGVSAARRHGLWTPTRVPLHVAVAHDARALRSPRSMRIRLATLRRPGVIVSWVEHRYPGTRSLVGVVGCLIHLAHTESPRVTFTCIESALNLGKMSRAEWRRASTRLPRALRRRLAVASILSESGGESLAIWGLTEARIIFTQQVHIPGVGRVDLLVGRSLVIEIDGAEFHTTREKFEEDRRRDAVLSALGFRVLRFSYTQVADRWHEVLAAISASVSRADHMG